VTDPSTCRRRQRALAAIGDGHAGELAADEVTHLESLDAADRERALVSDLVDRRPPVAVQAAAALVRAVEGDARLVHLDRSELHRDGRGRFRVRRR
jgi:hypothetical protein